MAIASVVVARSAVRIRVRGVVQGVGFRPFVFRLASRLELSGWVLNDTDGVEIHAEGPDAALAAFARALLADAPPAAVIAHIVVEPDILEPAGGFEIRESESRGAPTARMSPDLPVCADCVAELFDPADRRFRYPYINCTNCGPRYSIVRALPYDRPHTTMAAWRLCKSCAAAYCDPGDRRFHAQPVACSACGPRYRLAGGKPGGADGATLLDYDAVEAAARLLQQGLIVAVKSIGGYHLACDAGDADAVARLRERKYRKEQAFAIMVPNIDAAQEIAWLDPGARELLNSLARPIVLAPARIEFPGVAPDNGDLGIMLPYAPLHHLLFAAGAPARLVMTSGNRSSEPIAYDDEEAFTRLAGLADAFLVGGRPIARRVDDSVVRAGALGPMVMRRSRGLAPSAVCTLPAELSLLAVGGDLKNAVTLVVDGQAYVSQHIGDLSYLDSRRAFREVIGDLLSIYEIERPAPAQGRVVNSAAHVPECAQAAGTALIIAHDMHPQYVSTAVAVEMEAARHVPVQHHRAHIASVLAERGAFERRCVGVALDGTGYGDDGSIWGGEFFVGSIAAGFDRVAHLRAAALAGGDAAARYPVQAAAGFIAQLDDVPDLRSAPFFFPRRYEQAQSIVRSDVRVFETTSAGRLFDAVAALAGFTRPITFEGQAAMWLEHQARRAVDDSLELPCAASEAEIDWRETLLAVVDARQRGVSTGSIARAFHRAFAQAIARVSTRLAGGSSTDIVVISGGVVQNDLLVRDIRDALPGSIALWTNRAVPPNDGGISLGQAAIAACSQLA